MCSCTCSAVLIGEPGVGKTSIIHGLSQRLVAGDVPESIRGARLIGLELGLLMAGKELGYYAVSQRICPDCSSRLQQRCALLPVMSSRKTRAMSSNFCRRNVLQFAGATFPGEFEERLRGVLAELTAAGSNSILFIDDIHSITGPNAQQGGGVNDASVMLKPLLARYVATCAPILYAHRAPSHT
jgi:ATP-dependent Clp protease ATP-binding subunit ClpB